VRREELILIKTRSETLTLLPREFLRCARAPSGIAGYGCDLDLRLTRTFRGSDRVASGRAGVDAIPSIVFGEWLIASQNFRAPHAGSAPRVAVLPMITILARPGDAGIICWWVDSFSDRHRIAGVGWGGIVGGCIGPVGSSGRFGGSA